MLETHYVRFAEWSSGDNEAFSVLARDPLVMRYINTGVPWTDGQIGEFIGRQMRWQATYGYCVWKLLRKTDGDLIGMCGIQPVTINGRDEIEIGWWLKPLEWGKGVATEAATAALRFAFEDKGLTRVIAIAQPANRASTRVMEKLGMSYEGPAVHKGIEVVVYAIQRR